MAEVVPSHSRPPLADPEGQMGLGTVEVKVVFRELQCLDESRP